MFCPLVFKHFADTVKALPISTKERTALITAFRKAIYG